MLADVIPLHMLLSVRTFFRASKKVILSLLPSPYPNTLTYVYLNYFIVYNLFIRFTRSLTFHVNAVIHCTYI